MVSKKFDSSSSGSLSNTIFENDGNDLNNEAHADTFEKDSDFLPKQTQILRNMGKEYQTI